LRRFYVDMVVARRFDEEAVALQRRGELTVYAPLRGQEACQIGSAHALSADDWIFPSYREPAALMVHGLDIATVLHINRGTWIGGTWDPRKERVAPYCVPLASQLPHAVGFALGSKLEGRGIVALAYFGEGSSSEGDFHEALNIASVMQVPVVFFCQNNQWAISVPLQKQMRGRLVDRAIGYGIPGVQVDGNDVVACYLATREAAERARNEFEPTLIEALTFRMGPHSTNDDTSRYDYDEALRKWTGGDPIERHENYLKHADLWSEDLVREAEEAAAVLVQRARDEVVNASEIALSAIFDTVFADPPPHVVAQRDEAAGDAQSRRS
jgi:2-oxoisovalerate dehydrogenase E1 component alpha subunit